MSTSEGIAPKRLVVCCDGTWQSSVSGLKNIPSNVTRLARSIARTGKDKNGKTWQQIVYYDAGIGTGEISKEEKDRQGGFGIGFLGNIIECYNFLVLNYAPGDKIFCFGFSRGAYTARAVAGLVNDIGIISPRDMQDFPDLFALYQQNNDSHGFRKSRAYREWVNGVPTFDVPVDPSSGLPRYEKPPHAPASEASRVVEVVGVFDTVGSLGVPDTPYVTVDLGLKIIGWRLGTPKVGFHNVSLSPYVRHAFHALALDEHRGPFSPTLWHYPADGDLTEKKPTKSHEQIAAEWKKVHADKNATAQQVSDAWKALIDCEMYEHIQGIKSRLLQCWFPGVHINIGGGSDDILNEKKGDLEQIALISFAWMCEQVSPFLQLEDGLETKVVTDRMNLIHPVLEEVAKGIKDFSKSWPKVWQALDWTGIYKADLVKIPDVSVHGWATGPIVDSFEGSVRLGGSIDRTPGRYVKDASGNRLGSTEEQIHPSVAFRQQTVAEYEPEGLKGFKRRLGANGYEYTNGTVTIPEFTIKAEHTMTRYMAAQDTTSKRNAAKFIEGIDQDLAKLAK